MTGPNNDIIIEILCLLGVEDLLRFRCVSKPWCSLIDDPDFIKLHVSRSLETNTNLSLIYRYNKQFYSVSIDSLEYPEKLNHPLNQSAMFDNIFNAVVGSCNGLMALINNQREISLWNPSTRKSKMLPFTQLSSSSFFREYYGFGYDLVSDDYKLVRMLQFYVKDDDCFRSEVEIYSLRTNSCRKIKDFAFHLSRYRAQGVLANNAVHWLASNIPKSDTQNLVVAFDLGSEEYRVVELSDYLDERFKELFRVEVGAIGGYLCLIATFWNFEYVADVWIMKEYGVKESWTKLLSLKFSDPIEVLPLTFSKNRKRVLLNIGFTKFVWYNIGKETVEEVKIKGVRGFYGVNMHMLVGSLVPL